MNKFINVEFSKEEIMFLNSITLEHCMQSAQIVASQTDQVRIVEAINVAQAAAMVQKLIVGNALSQNWDWPEQVIDFLKRILERATEEVKNLKEIALKNGRPEFLQLSETHEIAEKIIKKIPEPSKIIV